VSASTLHLHVDGDAIADAITQSLDQALGNKPAWHYDPAMNGDTISAREFAEHIAVDPGSVYRALRRGEIHGFRFGKQIRIPRSELERITQRPAYPREAQS